MATGKLLIGGVLESKNSARETAIASSNNAKSPKSSQAKRSAICKRYANYQSPVERKKSLCSLFSLCIALCSPSIPVSLPVSIDLLFVALG